MLYGVETRVLVQQVRRNAKRFPSHFMFQLTSVEAEALRSQIVISNEGRGGRRYAPYVFTEQGIAMLSGVLRSDRAIAVNIAIMRAFVGLRRAAAGYAALEKRLDQLERDTSSKLGQHDERLDEVFRVRQLIAPPRPTKAGHRVQGARGRVAVSRCAARGCERPLERFPDDFMFQLQDDEAVALRSQIVTSNRPSKRRNEDPCF